MAGTISPFPKHTFWDNNGAIAASHKLFTYLAGTSTKQTTYSDSALGSANTNPIVLDSSGRATIFLPPNTSWKFVLAPPTDSDPPVAALWTVDNVQNVPTGTINVDVDGTAGENLAALDVVYLSDGSGSLTAGRWYKADADFSYASSQAGTIGIAVGAITSGSSGSIRIDGRVTGLAGLTAGIVYYASATAGALTSTAPGNAVIVGQADSSTSLVISARAGATAAFGQTIGNVNLLADPTFLIWPAGDAAAPAHWLLGASATVARAGTGLGDTNRKVGDFCAKLTSPGGIVGTLTQSLLPANAMTRANFLKGRTVSAGAWLYSTTGNTARIALNDGVTQGFSSYAPGTSTWTWLTTTLTIDSAAPINLSFYLEVAPGSLTGYISGPVVVLGPVAPTAYQPAQSHYETIRWKIAGAVTTGTDKDRWIITRPAIVKDVQLDIGTAPTVTSLIVDVNSWDGAAFTTMCTTKPTILATAFLGAAQPDATYARRCLTGLFGTTSGAGTLLSFDVDQVGGGVAGSDLYVAVRFLVYDRPLEEFLAYNDIN